MSIVTQSVTVQHPRALSVHLIKSTIDEAGYDILSTPTAQDAPQLWSDSLHGLSCVPPSRQHRKKHLDNCAQCRAEEADVQHLSGEHAGMVSAAILIAGPHVRAKHVSPPGVQRKADR